MTRSMAKQQAAEIPAMYPLKGDHKLPEVSQTGIIKLPAKLVNNVDPNKEMPLGANKHLENVNRQNLDIRNPIVNRPANVIRTGPIQPTQSVTQPVMDKIEREMMEKLKLKNRNINPFYKSRLVEPVPTDVRLVGKLPAYDIEMNEG